PRVALGATADDAPAILAVTAEIESQPLRIGHGLALPARRRRAIRGPFWFEPGLEARGLDVRDDAVCGHRLARFERQVVDPERARTRLAPAHRDLDGDRLAQLAVAAGTPRVRQPRAPHLHLLPDQREGVARPAPPPHVAARVDDLELEGAFRRLATQLEREREVLGQREPHLLAQDDEARAVGEVVVEPQRRPRVVSLPHELRRRAGRARDGPVAWGLEVVDRHGLSDGGLRGSYARRRVEASRKQRR